jgi:ATP-dependent RNA helicase DeaD
MTVESSSACADPSTSSTSPVASAFDSVPAVFREALHRKGFTELTAIQREVLARDVQGRCLRISSQTGSGKTLALGMVIGRGLEGGATRFDDGPRALVVTPTRELAMQVRDELAWLYADLDGAFVGVVTGGVDIVPERRMLQRKPAVLVGTPGRLLDHARGDSLRFDAIEHVVLDEADRMLDMGFREELEAILERLPAERRTHLVSATFPPHVERLASAIQSDVLHIEGTALGDANASIDHVAHLIDPRSMYAFLVNALLLEEGRRVLVFVERRCDATSLAEALVRDGFGAQAFSGDLSQAQRTRTLEAFRRGQTPILVSTDVAARGIDVADISLVIHVAMPSDAESYVHRAGRTGRAGARGTSLALVPGRAKFYFERLARLGGVQVDWRPPPSAAKVRKQIRKRARKALVASLDGATPGAERIEDATRLLEGRDAAVVVATLLDALRPSLPCEPMAVPTEPPPVAEPRHARRLGRGRPKHAGRPRRR